MIRRVNDEEGIQKLVTEVFMKMWFTACKDNNKVNNFYIHKNVLEISNKSYFLGDNPKKNITNY